MIYKGYKIRVRCIDWEQVEKLDAYWNYVGSQVDCEKIVGLGMNWTDDGQYFDYALGVIGDERTLAKLNAINFSEANFDTKYVEIHLPAPNEWKTFRGKDDNVKQIYEESIDCNNKAYDYELEYIDSEGNIEIKIHFVNNN